MEAQVVTSVQGGLPPPGGRALAKGVPLGETPELQALFQSLMASLMGPLVMDQPAMPSTEQQGNAVTLEANGSAILATPTQDGVAAWMVQGHPFMITQGADPLSSAVVHKSMVATTPAPDLLLTNQKPTVDQAQPAPILADDTADLALLRVPAAGQPVAANIAGMAATDQSALQTATAAQKLSTQENEGGEEQARPRVEVAATSPSLTPAGTAPLMNSNTVQAAVAPARSVESSPFQQIADRVQVTLDQGENSATIRLQPEELGGVRIRLQVQDGQIHLSIQAEKPQTGRLLDQQLGDLRQSLESGGIKVGDLAVLASSRPPLAGADTLGREAAQALKTLSMEMGGNSAQQHNHHQQQAAFAGQDGHPERGDLPHYGQQMADKRQFGDAGIERASASDPCGWQSAPRGVDYYA